jgi:hypothetical protein
MFAVGRKADLASGLGSPTSADEGIVPLLAAELATERGFQFPDLRIRRVLERAYWD